MWLKTQKQPAKAFRRILLAFTSQQLSHLVPRSHKFQDHFSLSQSNRDHDLQRELPTAGNLLTEMQQPWRIPKWLTAHRTGHRQVIHITSPIASTHVVLDLCWQQEKALGLPGSDPSQVSVACQTDTSMTWSRISQPSPFERAYWTEQSSAFNPPICN